MVPSALCWSVRRELRDMFPSYNKARASDLWVGIRTRILQLDWND